MTRTCTVEWHAGRFGPASVTYEGDGAARSGVGLARSVSERGRVADVTLRVGGEVVACHAYSGGVLTGRE